MPGEDWDQLLQRGLQHWGAGKLDPAVGTLELCLKQLKEQPQTELYRVLVSASLAHIHLETGYFDMSEEAQFQARELWSQQLFDSRWVDINPTLTWFEGLLGACGLPDEAQLYNYSVSQNSAAFLGHDRVGAFGPKVSQQNVSGAEHSDFQMPTLVAARLPSKITPALWGNYLRSGITSAQLGRRNDMANDLLEARAIGVHVRPQDSGMRLFWSAWVECLCCFLVAEYGQSDRARQDCDELWLGLSLKPDLLNDPTTLEVCALLEEFEYLAIAQRIRCDLATGAAPTLDAWRGLKVALKVLGQNDQNAEHQWVEVVTDCCVGLQSGDFKDIENRAARSKARLETLKRDAQQAGIESHFKLGLILLDHLLSLVAQKQGKYSFADSLFSQANREWLSVPMHLRAQGPWVRLYLNAALENGCPFLAENFPVQLYNPGGEKHGMVQLGAAAAPLLGQEDWQECLTRAWAWAREGKHDVALRSAATAERSARKVSIRNLKVALALNTQAAISWLMGSYAEGLASYRESLSMWNMEEADEALVTRFVIAVEAGWPELAEKLKVRRSAGLPVLVDPDADLSSVEMTRWKRAELPDATLPDEATTRKSKTGGWFAQLKGMLSRREKLDD